MEKLINKTLRKEDVAKYVGKNDRPIRNTVATKPAISFTTDLHSILYKSKEDRDNDFEVLMEMYQDA